MMSFQNNIYRRVQDILTAFGEIPAHIDKMWL